MKIELKDVDNSNWRDVLKLSVSDDQRHFVANNAYSLVQSVFDDEYIGRVKTQGIYADDVLVGFVMCSADDADQLEKDGACWVDRYMIDTKFQGKGYGRAALAQLIDHVKQNTKFEKMRISYEPDNAVAQKLYLSFGFVEEGVHPEWKEMVAVLEF